ncbi:2-polyprenyl-3-methyl-6-methoxy-1,4-benzoquinone monooxygenase [Alcaligenaceae bacterium]|nr:2-polyprenyl-3-methyl-6-methoxy-1,4-benzoquinone monooxygenase [Alcaligenaceae bacterium]
MVIDNVPTKSGFARRTGVVDGVLSELGRAMQVLAGTMPAARPNPAGPVSAIDTSTDALTDEQQRHAAGLMRVNHVGEICAQALYRGQAVFCRDAAIQKILLEAAAEEVDHLVWCNDRLLELNSRPSVFNPLWYISSFSLGLLAGRAGVGKNLGFMAETERQVEDHLERHLQDLPLIDQRSRAIVTQMRDDEIQHRTTAEHHGAQALPSVIKLAMKAMSKVMTTTAYRI